MGMYTELVLGFKTRNLELVEFVNYLIQGEGEKYGDRRDWMLHSSSYYFPCSEAFSSAKIDNLGHHNYSIRCNLKNYKQEIQWFLKEVFNKLEYTSDLLGYYRYEEDEKPTLIYMPITDEELKPAPSTEHP